MVSPSEESTTVPRHVAIIMDGNGRWAARRRLPRLEGHRRGARSVRRAVEFCRRRGIGILTLYAFSTENWQRPKSEVSGLMELLSRYIDTELDEIHANDIRVMTIGDLSRIPARLVKKIEGARQLTGNNRSMVLNIALSYGGRREIVDAAVRLADAMKAGTVDPAEVTEATFADFLSTAGLSDPDLLIRTGGEVRVSNFLLWQIAYAELYFTDILWPDFDDDAFMGAIETYRARQRRFGMTSEQIASEEEQG